MGLGRVAAAIERWRAADMVELRENIMQVSNETIRKKFAYKGAWCGKRQLAIASEPAKCTKMIEFCTIFWLFCTKLSKMRKKPRISARFLVVFRA